MGRRDTANEDLATVAATPPLRAWLLGTPRMLLGERVLTNDVWVRRGARSLLLLLLSVPDRRLPRDTVLDTLWPDADPATATNALYISLHAMRRALEPNLRTGRQSAYVEVRGGTVGLRARSDLFVDVEAFRSAIVRADGATGADRAAALREAVALYGGDFVADEPYADWPLATRERLRRDWRRAVLDMSELERAAGRPLAPVRALEALLATDPTDETVQRALMQAHAAAGQREDALRQFERCVAVLRDDLDAQPDPATVALAEAIRSAGPSLPTALPAVGSIRLPPVPVPPSRLIGRAPELAALEALLADAEVRLITLVGPGGIGKTRLAIEAARRAVQPADGVGFVSLGMVRDRDLVMPTIARAVGIEESPSRSSIEQLNDAFYQRALLLVIDNFEQVIDAATDLAALLEGNSGLRLLVTSREPLHVRAERVQVVPPIPVPPIAARGVPGPTNAAVVGAYDGVTLFVERARALRPDFELDDATTSAIGEICARVDGLPLAIELAAARCRHLDPPELLRRLEPRLPVLTGGPRDLPARLRTMHDAIAWSYDLLTEAEQLVFRRLSVFVGGCGLHAAEAVSGQGPVDTLVQSLADKSLVHLERGEEHRVTMLETVREFGILKLAETGEEDQIRLAHAICFLDWAEEAASRLTGPEQQAWLRRFDTEHDNLRAASETLLRTDAVPDGALRLTRALFDFWRTHGYYTEGRARLHRALELPGSRNLARARSLSSAADLAESQGDYAAAEAMYREALAIFEELRDRRGTAEATAGMAAIAIDRSDLVQTVEWADRALATYRQLGDSRGAAVSLNHLAAVAFFRGQLDDAARLWQQCIEALALAGDEHAQSVVLSNLGALELVLGQPEKAIERHREAVAIARRLEDNLAIVPALINLGRALVSLGRAVEARSHLEEARDRCAQLGDPVNGSSALQVLAIAALAEEQPELAAALLEESLSMANGVGERVMAATTLELAGGVAVAYGVPDVAATIFGGVDALREATGSKREAVDEPAYARSVEATRAALGPERFGVAWDRGRALPYEAVVEEAHAALRSLSTAASG